ncbi:GNAT family N-acetyltransferase [Kitasatospora sp. NPDC058965]|uniref:GNAT family N-acetyltransferase n=1 Tax=Kitasatospora sp. NPDC058965 TaxID=3346682 RepID=UPI003688636B
MPELRTARLRLRQWHDADLDRLAALDADPEVMRYIADGTTHTREQTAESLLRIRTGWAERGFGLFAVELLDSGRFAGWVGLNVPRFLPEILPAVEIGWRLRRDCWGHGYATEGARAVLDFGFETVGLERIVSIHQLPNTASARVMAKLGMVPERRTTVPGGRPVQVTELTRQAYRELRAAAP